MSIWIKANKLVARHLSVGRSRKKLLDGCYLLWFRDMERFGPLTSLDQTIASIGGLRLTGSQAAQERDGTILRPLPLATDPRFFIEYEANRDGIQATAPQQEPEQYERQPSATEQAPEDTPTEPTTTGDPGEQAL